MLRKTKGFISGFISCALLSVLIMNVFAVPIEKVITATYNNIKIYVDGNKIDPKDANGNPVEPFIYNGTTYLPVRAIGEALGKSVEWDGVNSTVYIGGNPNSNTPSIWLDEMDYFNYQIYRSENFSSWTKNPLKDTEGNTHERGIRYNMNYGGIWDYKGWQSTTYLLNSKYTRFTAGFSLLYDYRTFSKNITLTIYGDDKQIFKTVTSAGKLPEMIDIDVTGIIKFEIRIDITERDSYSGVVVLLTEAGFYELSK